jgi:hypothetical protein
MSKDFESDEDQLRLEQVIAIRYINGDVSGCCAKIKQDINPANLVLLVVGELGLTFGYEDALSRVQRMMGWR